MKILSVVGARPQFVKAAMLSLAIKKHNRGSSARRKIRQVLVHTGQHYDPNLSDVFFEQLPLPKPQHSLGVGSAPHGAQTAAMLERLEPALLSEKPDLVVVYGDTNSALAGALAAAKLHMLVAHVEAGLRSFNRSMPEEINRIATDHISDLLLCPTPTAVANLKNEGITRGVSLTGDVMLDAVHEFRGLAERRNILAQLNLAHKKYALVTIHRAENTDSYERLRFTVDVLAKLQIPAVFPMHPRLRHALAADVRCRAFGNKLRQAKELRIIPPVSYLDMLLLEKRAQLVLTDSGGVQKEAYFLSVPCVTLRQETEWVETLDGGWNRLAGRTASDTLAAVRALWAGNGVQPRRAPDLDSFGGGRAAENAVIAIVSHLKQRPRL